MLDNLPRLSTKLRNDVRELRRAAKREDRRQYLAEGTHLALELQKSSIQPDLVAIREDADNEVIQIAERYVNDGVDVYISSGKNMDMMADVNSPQAILCVVPYHAERPLEDRILVLDAVSDPGNVGTMIRTAAWFGFSDVVLGEGCADLYNPKTMRATSGAALRINVLRKRQIPGWIETLDERPCFAAVPRGGEPPVAMHDHDRFALVIGSEAHGISEETLEACTHSVSIPGDANVESLNAATAAAILCYEGRRP